MASAGVERYLEGRTAIVTGGFSGIGLAIAEELSQRGAAVAIGSRAGGGAQDLHMDDAPTLKAALNSPLEAGGRSALGGRLDVCDTGSVEAFCANVAESLGQTDILVNSAGLSHHSPVSVHSEEDWLKVIDTNLNGAFRMTRACLPSMMARGWGRVINIASTAARTGHVEYAAYCASKSGLLGLTRVTALEGAEHGVSCVALSPTWVETRMLRNSMELLANEAGAERSAADMIEETRQMSPQKRIVQPVEIAAMAAFLCREEAVGITMEDIQISAGGFW